MRIALRIVSGLLVLAAFALGCAHRSDHGLIHVVQRGETVWRISQRYGVKVDDVVRANKIRDVTRVRTGAKLWIPDPTRNRRGAPAYPPSSGRVAAAKGRKHVREELGLSFGWPVKGSLTSRFGPRNGRPHEGIDVGARRGTAVHAAEAGRVIYSGHGLGAYGNVVIVKHEGRFSTVYAHNRKNRIKKGAFVEKGQVIAEVGSTGRATGPHLHFEVRRGKTPLDPLRYLP